MKAFPKNDPDNRNFHFLLENDIELEEITYKV